MDKIKKIVIVDDDGTTNFVTERLLKNYNQEYQIISYISSVKALEDLVAIDKNNEPLPDLIFLDINMPQLDGFEFLDKMRQLNLAEKTQVIMYTSSLSPIDKRHSENFTNVIGFMEKPFSTHAYDQLIDVNAK